MAAEVKLKCLTIVCSFILLFCIVNAARSSYRSYRSYRSRYARTYSRTYSGYSSYRASRYRTYTPYRYYYTYRSTSYRSPYVYRYRAPATRYTRYATNYRASLGSYRTYRSSRTSYTPYRYYSSMYRSALVRYARHYSSGRYYYYYYNMYFSKPYQSGYYARKSYRRSSVTTCKNYEANANGTAIGVFACPNSWEPASFTWCCGETNFEYCCEFFDVKGHLAGVIIGIIIGLALIIGVTACCCKYCKKPKKANPTTRYQKVIGGSRAIAPARPSAPPSDPPQSSDAYPPLAYTDGYGMQPAAYPPSASYSGFNYGFDYGPTNS